LISDFEARLRLAILTANEPFLFYTGSGKGYYTGVMAWSLKGFINVLKTVTIKAVEFHNANGDFESWARFSLKDAKLADSFQFLKERKGEPLRKALLSAASKRFANQNKEVLDATQLS
jgi:hypothetical protein